MSRQDASRGQQRARHTIAATLALAGYLYALLCAPWLHARHHALHGADHVHEPGGTRALAPAFPAEPDLVAAHDDFHADLAALALDDAATAGTLAVDCSLAAYTLAECDGAAHAPRFGDAIVAHHRHRPAADPLHGQGALEHLAKSLLCPAPIVLPPPSAPHAAEAERLADAQLDSIAAAAPNARGPPA